MIQQLPNIFYIFRTPLLAIVCVFLLSAASAQLHLPRLVSDGMILQQRVENRIWGWTDAAETVSLTWQGMKYTQVADATGYWHMLLPAHSAGGPFQIELSTPQDTVVVQDIYLGEVWLCSGQSNMELTMHRARDAYPEEMERESFPVIRQFIVPDTYNFDTPQNDLTAGEWVPLTDESIHDFTAVGYFFANEINKKLNVPVGIINAALGGSPIEAWMSEEILQNYPPAYQEMVNFKDQNLIDSITQAETQAIRNWHQVLDDKDLGLKEGSPDWARQPWMEDKQKEVMVPGYWTDHPELDKNGVFWFQKSFEVPPSFIENKSNLWLGRIIDQDFVYVNGQFVGGTGYQYPPRKYEVPARLLHAGHNQVTVRILSKSGTGGFVPDKPYLLFSDQDSVQLTGSWNYRIGAHSDGPVPSTTFIRWKPGGLYNAMIAPLENYRIQGVLWYQGESNTGYPSGYADKYEDMVMDWRKAWGSPTLPFLSVQLANFMDTTYQPVESNWAELRQEQLKTVRIPHTGMAVTTDLGEYNDIHPLNKKEVGIRLSLLARKMAYGEENLAAQSPLPDAYTFGMDTVRISFASYTDLLHVKGSPEPGEIAISADGENYTWAKAEIEGSHLRVWHPEIKNPQAVRYGWADNPVQANLYSKKGLPVSPFQIIK